MDAITFPFRFERGQVVHSNRDSDAYAAQKILTVLQTRPNELPIRPDFGTTDPLFDQIDQAGLFSTVATFFSELSIQGVQQQINADGKVEVTIEYGRTTTQVAALS